MLAVGLARDESEAALTQEVRARVVKAEQQRNTGTAARTAGHDLEFRYQVAEQWYAGEEWVAEEIWQPPAIGLTICVDSESPGTHAVVTMPGAQCGDEHLGTDARQAEVTTAP